MSDAQPLSAQEFTPQEFARLYDELRRMAHAQMSGERTDHSLQTTALVNEAYLRLYGDRQSAPTDRPRFFAAAALDNSDGTAPKRLSATAWRRRI